MMKNLIIILAFILLSYNSFAQLGGQPGAFTRMGFGSRGISMGNAMTSVNKGDLVGYYNPAVSVFQNDHLINLSYSFLSFDRSLNFLSYTKNFKLPNQKDAGAGVTFSLINMNVTDIDGRDIDGFHSDNYTVFENQFSFTPSIRFSDKFAAGVGFKFFYSKMFEGVTSSGFGFDLGAIYSISDKINAGLTVKDIKTSYEWNTNEIYGSLGGVTKEKFPLLYTIGFSYQLPANIGLVAADLELSDKKSKIIRLGVEMTPVKHFSFRGGIDRFDFNETDKFGSSKVMFGIGYQRPVGSFLVGIDYSFVMEPYSNKPFQTLSAIFKIK